MLASHASTDWDEVTATVVESRLRHERGSGDGGPTHAADVLYRYEVDGQTYLSNRVNFVGGTSGDRGFHQPVVDAHPPGRRFTAYVDPREPSSAVVQRDLGRQAVWALIPGVFTLLGLAGVGGGLWAVLRPDPAAAATSPADGERNSATVAIVGFALFWNAIAWTLAVIFSSQSDWGDTPPLLRGPVYLFPAIGVGLASLAAWSVCRRVALRVTADE